MMADETAETAILKRMVKAGAGGAAAAVPAQVLGASIAKAAEAVLGLPVTVSQLAATPVTLCDLGEHLEERALLALIEGPGERLGLIALSPDLVGTVIEMLTTGRMAGAVPVTRRPTRTDAALCAGLIDRVLTQTDEGAAVIWADWTPSFRYASSVEDARLVPLLLEDVVYRLYRCTLALGEDGMRTGAISFCLPEARKAVARPPGAEATEAWQRQLAGTLMEAEVEVTAILARVMRPVAEVMALAPGTLLMLPEGAIGRVRLEGRGRRMLTEARLGQYRGYLAVRLTKMPNLGEPGSRDMQEARGAGHGADFDLPFDAQLAGARVAAG
jgi:flagellar motor switch protein FliM